MIYLRITVILFVLLVFAGSCNTKPNNPPDVSKPSQGEAKDSSKIAGDSIVISLCDVPKMFIDTPLLNTTFVSSMFVSRGVIQGFVKRKLNDPEKKYLSEHRVNSLQGFFCAIGAEFATSGIEGRRDGKGDALRHGFWGACMTKFLGPVEAQKILDNHENGSANKMDAENNIIAVAIGKRMNGASLEELWMAVVDSYDKGDLKSDIPPIANTDSIPGNPAPSPKPNRGGGDGGGLGKDVSSNPSVRDFVRDARRQAERNKLDVGEVTVTEEGSSGTIIQIRFKVRQQ